MTIVRGRQVVISDHFRGRVKKRFSKKNDDAFIERFGVSIATEILTAGTRTFVSKSAPDTFGRCKYVLTCPETRESITVVAFVDPRSITLVTTYRNDVKPPPSVRKATTADYLRLFGKAPAHHYADLEEGTLS